MLQRPIYSVKQMVQSPKWLPMYSVVTYSLRRKTTGKKLNDCTLQASRGEKRDRLTVMQMTPLR